MKKGYILAHDLGTTGNKATLYDSMGKLIASSFHSYVTHYPGVNWAEQDPLDWWKAVCISTEDLLKKARISNKNVACVSFSGQMMGCLPLDRQGNPLRNSIIGQIKEELSRQTELGRLWERMRYIQSPVIASAPLILRPILYGRMRGACQVI